MNDLKIIIFFSIVIGGILFLRYKNIEDEKNAEAKHQQEMYRLMQYNNSPEGQDKMARKQSLNGNITLSLTGNKYYRGMYCQNNCAGHQAGYEWSMKLGITNEDACDNVSKSFEEGCLKGIEETLEELRNYFREQYPEDCLEEDDNFIMDEEAHGKFY